MKSPKVSFVCNQCGYTSIKWIGRCPECEQWNTFEEIEAPKSIVSRTRKTENRPELLSELTLPNFIRTKTGMNELDRVLGGGLVDSSVVLLSG